MFSGLGFEKRPASGTVSKGSLPSGTGIGADYSGLPTVGKLQNPTVKSNVPEVQINPTASVPLFVRPYTQEFQTKFAEGDLLFIRRDEAASRNGYHVVANLPVLNYLLRTTKDENGNRIYDNIEKVIVGDTSKGGDGAWRFFGIMRNDMDVSSDSSRLQRLLNVDVRGRARVARYWRPDGGIPLKRGDTVWIRFEEVSVPQAKTINNPNSIPEVHQSGTYVQARAICAGNSDYMTTDTVCQQIPIGVVSQATLKAPSSVSVSKAHNEMNASNQLERIEVLIRI